ncbi:MAG: NAD(P)H-dependent oxidoreductase subunit E [Candidatus Fermentithermobacillus carboniphilus]|uniref:NAD(P)H-dependent oxidoreductase subunit E n=1 Tax=Candidatus Fermentithermobacillus carboniphilus TaxID=3085328 RepID=A0AAT9LEM8_9FIRM|nr:MAG: NAD(P)H-dependent oxidoreductase subunit E [Candidatus Fermentithermobacillus carboniphilus]
MIEVEVCVGSSCFLRGSEDVVRAFQALIEEKCPGCVVVKGSFCMGRCTGGVTVKIRDEYFSGVRQADVPRLFDKYILPHVR